MTILPQIIFMDTHTPKAYHICSIKYMNISVAVNNIYLQDVIGCTTEMDFLLWPRNDIDRIECLLFSRWKGDEETPYKPLKVI